MGAMKAALFVKTTLLAGSMRGGRPDHRAVNGETLPDVGFVAGIIRPGQLHYPSATSIGHSSSSCSSRRVGDRPWRLFGNVSQPIVIGFRWQPLIVTQHCWSVAADLWRCSLFRV
jgi:hypothetical protein